MTMVRPSQLFGEAFSICGDVFCAALISHTVLRTLGRSETGFYTDPLTGEVHDENPKWVRDRPDFWKTAAAEIQGSLTPLRGDERGDGFGEWYHFFGVLTFSVHEMTLHGNLKEVVFAVKSGTFLNPILAGGKEDPVKVQLDHDSIAVSGIYLSGEAETGICAGAY
ncbi:MAG: hypothetical protein ACXWP5_16725, partial [Bdellovibrionota bacterium]